MPVTRMTTPTRSSQVLAIANSIDTLDGRNSSPTAIQFQILPRISWAASSNRLGRNDRFERRLQRRRASWT